MTNQTATTGRALPKLPAGAAVPIDAVLVKSDIVAKRCVRYLLVVGIVGVVGLALAVWLHDASHVAISVMLIVTGFAGAYAIVAYRQGHRYAATVAERDAQQATAVALRETAAADRAHAEALAAAQQATAGAVRSAVDELNEATRVAQAPCAITFDTSDQGVGDGYLYVLRFGTGAIKVGQTAKLRRRIYDHVRDAEAVGVAVTAYWFSPAHRNFQSTERSLIRYCIRTAQRRSKSEYFHGADFGSVARYASALVAVAQREETGK